MQSNKSIREFLYWDPRYATNFPKPIQINEQNPDKIDWTILSGNPNAIPLLKEELDYDDMKKKMQPFAEELTAYVFHPVRMNKIAQQYNIPFDELINDIY